ncbi:MAG TPA: hypothetical protein VEX63_03745 [Flavisolibacter sp.]|nr:hypothetical protein [Flavisolibacter sp.]
MEVIYFLLNPFQFRQVLLFGILGFVALILIAFGIVEYKKR